MIKVIRDYLGEQVGMGIYDFPENTAILKRYGTPAPLTIEQLIERDSFSDKYHGNDRPGCCWVKKRREIVGTFINKKKEKKNHYLDIYTCIHCGVEGLRSGWQLHWYGGTYSLDLE